MMDWPVEDYCTAVHLRRNAKNEVGSDAVPSCGPEAEEDRTAHDLDMAVKETGQG